MTSIGKLLGFLILCLIAAATLLLCRSCGQAAPEDATVRLTSHGASGTTVWVGGGRSLILTCAHCFEGRDRYKAIVVDSPSPNPTAAQRPGVRLLKVDFHTDLALVEVGAELPYVAPIAPVGHRPGRLLSVGYDKMTWPSVKATATLVGKDSLRSYTREHPVPGRSGGALLDADSGCVLGTCTGYEVGGPGLYSSHAAVIRFVGWEKQFTLPAPYGGGQSWTPGVGQQLQPQAGVGSYQYAYPPQQPFCPPGGT